MLWQHRGLCPLHLLEMYLVLLSMSLRRMLAVLLQWLHHCIKHIMPVIRLVILLVHPLGIHQGQWASHGAQTLTVWFL